MRQLDHDTALKKFLLDKAQERTEMAEGRANERKKNFEEKSERQAEKVLKVGGGSIFYKILFFSMISYDP